MSNIILLNDIYPFKVAPEPQLEKDILFTEFKTADQYWRKPEPPKPWKQMTPREKDKYIERESIRVFETGVHFASNGKIVWMPPEAYFFWTYWKMNTGYGQFRHSQLNEFYFERFCEEDPWSIGGIGFKKRRDGRTERRMAKMYWKGIQHDDAWLGIQSKTNDDAKDVCFHKLKRGWKKLPSFLKPPTSGTTDPKTRLEFTEPAKRITRTNMKTIMDEEDESQNTIIDFRATIEDAYDGQQCLEITLDEFAKWEGASALKAANTYIQSVTLDDVKVGHIWAISSPAEKNNRSHKEAVEWWESADYAKVKDINAWKFHRFFTSALESYAGAIDTAAVGRTYGYANQDYARMKIMEQRSAAAPSVLQEKIRQTPITIDEVLGSTDDDIWTNTKEIRKRKIYLVGTVYKDKAKAQRKYVYGNYEWKDGIPDTEVVFKIANNQNKFTSQGRWIIAYQAEEGRTNIHTVKKKLKGANLIIPPKDSEHVLGIDPYDYRRTDSSKPSLGAGVMGKCFDFFGSGRRNVINGVYLFRPPSPEEYYEDMIKWCFYYGAFANIEARNKNIIDHFEDRGYFEYCLPKNIRDKKKEDIKGNPTTVPLIQEMCSLIDSYFSLPDSQDEQNNFDVTWIEQVLEDILLFDPKDTKKSDVTMALGQMFLGFQKRRLLYRMKKKPDDNQSQEMADAVENLIF